MPHRSPYLADSPTLHHPGGFIPSTYTSFVISTDHCITVLARPFRPFGSRHGCNQNSTARLVRGTCIWCFGDAVKGGTTLIGTENICFGRLVTTLCYFAHTDSEAYHCLLTYDHRFTSLVGDSRCQRVQILDVE